MLFGLFVYLESEYLNSVHLAVSISRKLGIKEKEAVMHIHTSCIRKPGFFDFVFLFFVGVMESLCNRVIFIIY